MPPHDVVRHDGDDPYLVVAADKGTATFSDIANDVAADYRYWLGDAFASGGSAGYDHKAMGITARGAWMSVERHFRELGVDTATTDFTCVGVGDMSGDVFGNAMLLSPHTRLVAAFDHRHVFVDPHPDAGPSWAERRRLFDLPRSSWGDYDRSLLSAGGGIWSRAVKSITLTDEIRSSLGIADDVRALTPAALIKAILKAPVDLFFNGGIGTYVKASSESHADVGDRANDVVRIDGGELRARCVGEGGNLGLTQLGRIEYSRTGGRVTTDFIDNSAGVDTSDHEVNIKILLDRVVGAGDLTVKQRNVFLASMTDEVGELVLAHNVAQNVALANAVAQAAALLHVHSGWMTRLEDAGLLDRELEFLPSETEMSELRAAGGGLTQPELSVLMAYTKIALTHELVASDVPEDPYLHGELVRYFPGPMRVRFADQMTAHRLRREIVATQVVGDLVDIGGITMFHRLSQETGTTAADVARAHVASRAIFGTDDALAGDHRARQRDRRGRSDSGPARLPDDRRAVEPVVAQQSSTPTVDRRHGGLLPAPDGPAVRCPARGAGRPGVSRVRGVAGRLRRRWALRGPRHPDRRPRACLCGLRDHRDGRPPRGRSDRGGSTCTPNSASGSNSTGCSPASSNCRGTTSGERWLEPPCATTSTPCTHGCWTRCSGSATPVTPPHCSRPGKPRNAR